MMLCTNVPMIKKVLVVGTGTFALSVREGVEGTCVLYLRSLVLLAGCGKTRILKHTNTVFESILRVEETQYAHWG